MPKRRPWSADSEIRLASQHVYGFNSAAHSHGLEPGEETLTDSAMLGLKRRRFPYVRFRGRLPDARLIFVHQFTLPQEGRVGADWNLMLRSTASRVNFRIQAKRLYRSGHYTARKKKQHKRLLAMSAAQGAIPLYAFYNSPGPGAVQSACAFRDQERLGCTVVLASAIDALPSVAWTNAGIGNLAIPIECLFACQCYGAGWAGGEPPSPGKSLDPLKSPSISLAQKVLQSPLSGKVELSTVDASAPLSEADDAVAAWLAGEDSDLLDNLATEYFPGVSHLVVAVTEPTDTPRAFIE